MKRTLLAAALAVFALAPGVGAACEYHDDSSASANSPEHLGMAPAPAPAATMVPAPKVAKAAAPNAAKPVTAKVKARAPDQKLAASAAN